MGSKRLLTCLASCLMLGLSVAAVADISQVNGAITVAVGQQPGNLSTVNGAISVGDTAAVGTVNTVNGAVTLGASAHAKSLATVNGQIQVRSGAQVSGNVTVVNGAVALDKGADVSGSVTTVNGPIQTTSAHVGHDIETVNGTIEIGADSRIDGGITVRKQRGWSLRKSQPTRVVIGPRVVVKGALTFERPVSLYISSSASTGRISGAQAIPFTGERPPK